MNCDRVLGSFGFLLSLSLLVLVSLCIYLFCFFPCFWDLCRLKEIRGGGEVRLTQGESMEGKLSVDYSGDPKRRLTFLLKTSRGEVENPNNPLSWNLTTDMELQHSATK